MLTIIALIVSVLCNIVVAICYVRLNKRLHTTRRQLAANYKMHLNATYGKYPVTHEAIKKSRDEFKYADVTRFDPPITFEPVWNEYSVHVVGKTSGFEQDITQFAHTAEEARDNLLKTKAYYIGDATLIGRVKVGNNK